MACLLMQSVSVTPAPTGNERHAKKITLCTQIGGAYLPSSITERNAAAVTRVPVGLSAYAPR